MTDPRRLNILILAEACNPEWPSVPLLGWRGAESLSRIANVHLVTQVRNKKAILRSRPPWPCTFIDTEDVAGPLYRLGVRLRRGTGRAWTLNSLIASLSYPLFEKRAWKCLGERVQNKQFDVVHRLTPVSPAFASSFAKRCAALAVPFVLGPINGGVPWPPGFEAERAREGERLGRFRGLHRYMPGYRATRDYASAILVGSRVALSELAGHHRSKATLLPENAVYEREVVANRNDFSDGPLRVGFVGRLVPLKGVHFLLEAFCRVADRSSGAMILDIIGDGPERARLEGLAKGRRDIRFHGRLTHQDVMASLRTFHVFAFPSIREFGGGAVLEAMASGAVPLIADYGGPRDLVPSGMGFRLPVTSREALTNDLEAKLEHCRRERRELADMSGLASGYVRQSLTWEARARTLLALYERLREQSQSGLAQAAQEAC